MESITPVVPEHVAETIKEETFKIINSKKGLSEEEVKEIRARGGQICYKRRMVEDPECPKGCHIEIDMAGKPYLIDDSTGQIKKAFVEPLSKRDRAKAKKLARKAEISNAIQELGLIAPKKGMNPMNNKRVLSNLKGMLDIHRAILEVKTEANISYVPEPKPKRVRKPKTKALEVSA